MSARHSRLGEVAAAVAGVGGLATMLVPGDTLTLGFASAEAAPGQTRDWFLLSRGVYTSTPLPARQEPVEPLPRRFELAQNQPNPFGSTTSIRFALPMSGLVGLEVFDAQGRKVRALVERELPAGYHEVAWDRRDESGSVVKPGVYLYRLTAGSFRDQRKMVLLP